MTRIIRRLLGKLLCRMRMHDWTDLANVLDVEADTVDCCRRCHQWRWP